MPYSGWEQLAGEFAAETGEVIGVDPEAYPADTGANFRYQKSIEALPQRLDMPEPLTVEEVDAFDRTAATQEPPISRAKWIQPSRPPLASR